MKYFNNFTELMEQKVVPIYHYLRLDGNSKGGNRKIFACFYYKSSVWKIHSDTHIRELKKALTDIQQNNDPFIIAKTQSNRICLELRKELASSPKHIYIYLYK